VFVAQCGLLQQGYGHGIALRVARLEAELKSNRMLKDARDSVLISALLAGDARRVSIHNQSSNHILEFMLI
jgi:hypothetical protein